MFSPVSFAFSTTSAECDKKFWNPYIYFILGAKSFLILDSSLYPACPGGGAFACIDIIG
jgi:hypothetical protein